MLLEIEFYEKPIHIRKGEKRMKRHKINQLLFLILTAAVLLTSCGSTAHVDQSAPQGKKSSGVEETAETAQTVPAQTAAEQEEAGRADTAAGAASVSYASCPFFPAEDYPKVDGSTATLPLSYALFQAATGESEEKAMEVIRHEKTDTSYRNLAYGSCDLVLAYEPSDETREYIEEKANLQIKPIGRDALVFMVNTSNPVNSLTEEQLQAVYSGAITNWKELGGDDEEIVAFQRKQNSGSQTLMEKLCMKGIPMAEAPTYHYISSMGELLERVSSYDNQGNAIGYSVYFYARNMYSLPGLDFLSVDGVTPSNETIQNGSYPYVNEFYAAIRNDEPADSPARLLFDWLTSEEGQDLIADAGYVPVLEKLSAKGNAAKAMAVTEQGESSYALEEDQVILLDGDSWFNAPAVHIMNADMTERALLEGCSISKEIMVWSVNDPLILMDVKSSKRGLYDIAKGKWIIEPENVSIYLNGNGDYTFYKYGEPTRIYNGSEFWQIENKYLCTGEYYWIQDDTGYSIRRGEKEIRGHVDVADPEQTGIYLGPHRHIVKLDSETNGASLYTLDGELLFKPEYLEGELENWQDFSYRFIDGTDPKGLIHIRFWDDNDDVVAACIYDLETGDFLWLKDEDINACRRNKEGDYALQIESASGLSILTDSLEPLKASNGTPYEYCFGMDCYGYQNTESGNIVVENPDGSIHFEMPRHEEESTAYQGEMIAKGVILYANYKSKHYELISNGKLLCSSDSYSPAPASIAVRGEGGINREYAAVRISEDTYNFRIDTGELTYQTSTETCLY